MPRTDEQRLRLFCQQVEQTLSRRAVRDRTIEAKFSLSAHEGGDLVSTVSLGDDEDVRSLLMDVRKFLAPREDVFFPGITNIVHRLTADHDDLREANTHNRAAWNRDQQGDGVALVINDSRLTPAECFDLVINGVLFHLDEEKARQFESLPQMMREFALVAVNSLVINVLRTLHAQRNLVEELLRRSAL